MGKRSRESTAIESAVAVLVYPPPRSIELEPEDWLWATWRPRTSLPRPAPRPFDRKEALEHLDRVITHEAFALWHWSCAPMSVFLSKEEAHFWFLAVTNIVPPIKQNLEVFKALPEETFTGEVLIDDVLNVLVNPYWMRFERFELCVPLGSLFSAADIVILLTADAWFKPNRQNAIPWWGWSHNLVCGMRDYVLPYWTNTEIETARSLLRTRLVPFTQTPIPWGVYSLAAALGLHDELLEVVETWSSHPKEKRGWIYFPHACVHTTEHCQEVIFGLGSASLVESYTRHLRLGLRSPTSIRAWLAHTEYTALDVVKDSILAAQNGNPEGLLKTFALIKAPEAAPHMLELTLSCRLSKLARQWLRDNPAQAIAGLISVAAGRGKLADTAIEFLRTMKRRGYTEYIQTCIAHEPSEVAERIRDAVLNVEEKEYVPFDQQTTPEWLEQARATLSTKSNKKAS